MWQEARPSVEHSATKAAADKQVGQSVRVGGRGRGGGGTGGNPSWHASTYINHLLLLEEQRVAHAAVVVVNGAGKEVGIAALHHFRAVGAADLAPVSSQEAVVRLGEKPLCTGLHGNWIVTCKVA